MSKREDIVTGFYSELKDLRTVKLGVVERDPVIPDELPRTGFPAVTIESSNEQRTPISSDMYESTMEVELVIHVNGKNRDTQRNQVIQAIEDKIAGAVELNKTVNDLYISRIENILNGEASPYASVRVVYEVRYCY